MTPHRILIVDDEANIRRVLSANLRAAGYETVAASSGYEALEKLSEGKFDLVLLDKNMFGMGGIETLKQIKAKDADIIVIVMTAYQSVESAIAAMKEGAYDYITKPFDMDALKNTLKNALERKRLLEENRALKTKLGQKTGTNLIAKSKSMLQILELVEQIADSMSNVLIYGETGTGKEVIAKAIHDKSIRIDKPFVKVNCATLPENLLASELFGHVKGAFTDAIKDRAGRIQKAEGGTLFLDEIGELSPTTQVKLLRLAQDREYERLGSSETKKASVRITSATNKDLQKAIASSDFREDLYYRLNVISIKIPPLRERKEEIAALAYHFLNQYAETKEKSFTQISPEALQLLMDYSWPGNVRELENVIERAIAIGQGDILLLQHLPKEFRQEPSFPKVGTTLKEMEKQLILQTLEQTGGIFAKGLDEGMCRSFDIWWGWGSINPTSKSQRVNVLFALFATPDFAYIVKAVTSLLAILFAFDAISGERERGTLSLTLANSVSRGSLLLSKLVGGYVSLILPFALASLFGALFVSLSPSVPLRSDEWVRLVLILLASFGYIAMFFSLGILISAMTKKAASSAVILLFFWTIIVFAIPNAGALVAKQIAPMPSVQKLEEKKTQTSAAESGQTDKYCVGHFVSIPASRVYVCEHGFSQRGTT